MAKMLLTFVILAFTTRTISPVEMASTECGTTNFTRPLIWKGTRTVRGEWPFLTALFHVERNEFLCGGTLISSKHVLTAAHCIQNKDSQLKLDPAGIIVIIGAYNLTSSVEKGRQLRDVQEIYVHPEWKVYSDKYDADLAILLLIDIVLFTNYIRPVCMPADDTVIDDVRGSVAGWGITEIGSEPNKEFIKHASVTALNGIDCLTTDPIIAVLSSKRTFCGQGVDGSPNQGDSGGGFYVRTGSTWVQHGIVSALRTNATGYVDADSIVVYTSVVHFKQWITDTARQSSNRMGEAERKVERKIDLECVFQYSLNDKYGCWIHSLDIQSDNIAVASFTGSHLSEKTDQDVEIIVFFNGTMFFIPSGVGRMFKNVKEFIVYPDLSTKRLGPSHFQSLENLIDLWIANNEITILDYDSLKDLKQLKNFTLQDNNKLEILPRNLFRNNLLLESVYLNRNSLKTIDESTFVTNEKLIDVWLQMNELKVLPKNLFRNNLLLEIVSIYNNSLTAIDETIFETNVKLKTIYLDGNKIDILPRNLFRNNLMLKIVALAYNSLKTIDETTFETNVKLAKVFLNANKLEVLPKHLFRNNLMLEEAHFRDNSLKIIEIDFTSFSNVNIISFDYNVCIDAYYEVSDTKMYDNQLRNLKDLQNLISANCSDIVRDFSFPT